MSIWALLGIIALAGAIGGVINALMSDNGLPFPRWEEVGGARIWRPGWVTNVLVGLAAAVVSWGLYGPYANNALVGKQRTSTPQDLVLTLSSVVGAFLVGVGGSRYLTDQVDKNLLTATAAKAAAAGADPQASGAIATATPAGALRIADDLPEQAD